MVALPWSSQAQVATRAPFGAAGRVSRRLFAAGCPATRRLTTIVWCCIASFLLVDAIWLWISPLSFEHGNWKAFASLLAGVIVVRAAAFLASHRGRMSERRRILRGVVRKSELLGRGMLQLALISAVFLVFTYLVTAAALPLQDDALAAIDRRLGFDWPTFLATTNDNAHVAAVLTACYRSTGALLIAIVVWLSVSEQGARLAELLAALCLTFAGLAIGMIAVPTASAFAHFAPAPETFTNFAAAHGMWAFYPAFTALRDGSLTVIAFSSAEGIVGFPSFHAALGVVTLWGLRTCRWLLWPAAALNAIMMIAVLPVGGHHLTELLAGVLTAMAAIALTTVIASEAKHLFPSPRRGEGARA